jgi:hypothetical protein
MWNRSENHLYLVYRNIFVSASVNCSVIPKMIHTCFRLHTFKIQSVWALGPNNHLLHSAFASNILEGFDEDSGLLKCVVFTVEDTFCVSRRKSCCSVGTWCFEKPYIVLTHWILSAERHFQFPLNSYADQCSDGLLDGVLWYYALKLHSVWSCVPVWMKHAIHNLFLGVNIFSFALIKIINKLTNNEHTKLLNHMQKTVLCCDPIWKLYFLKFERLHVDTLYCCDLWRKLTQNLIFWVLIQSSWKVEASVWQNCEATLSLWPWRCSSPLSVSISKIVVYKMTVATWHELKYQYSSLDIVVQFFIF